MADERGFQSAMLCTSAAYRCLSTVALSARLLHPLGMLLMSGLDFSSNWAEIQGKWGNLAALGVCPILEVPL
jgi:hypothetical protein